MIIADGASRLRHILYAASPGPLDIVPEREERVRSQRNTRILRQPGALLLRGKYRRLFGKDGLPRPVCEHIHIVLPDIEVDRIVPVRPLYTLFKWKGQHPGRLS